jgi:small conductance mechanosensitive channel
MPRLPISDATLALLAAFALDLLVALLILALGWMAAGWVQQLLRRALVRVSRLDTTLRLMLASVARYAVLAFTVLAALSQLGIQTASLLALVGAAGLAIGLALKDSLSNIASGVMLIVLRPFRAGDAVVLAGQEGIVEQVRIFQTVLRTYQNHDVILPNSQITAAPIVNYTARAQRRIDLPVGIGYDDHLGRAREVLLQLAAANPKVLAEPAPDVLVSDLGESSVNLVLRAWVDTPEFVTARSELTEGITREFSRAGVSIPYPQRSLHVYHHDADGRPLAQIVAAVDDPDRG